MRNKNRQRNSVAFLCAVTVVSYLTVFISPAAFWPIGLFNYIIPVLISIQVVLLSWSLIRNRKLAWMPAICLLLGYYFIDNTINLFKAQSDDYHFNVLSFNTRLFRERGDYSKFNYNTIKWAIEENSDIKCFQEFSDNTKQERVRILSKLTQLGYHSYVETFEIAGSINSPGMAIFSKFPIINTGLMMLNENSINNCLFADIVINKDTVRIYNFHLRSMGLHLSEFRQVERISDKSQETVSKLSTASSKRAIELHTIISHIETCPYPYIIACDLNELIYGNIYYELKKIAENTFEEVGKGFGFTFNSVLFFLRIDHQFFSEGIEPAKFEVIRKIKSSDHFPLKGYYRLSGP